MVGISLVQELLGPVFKCGDRVGASGEAQRLLVLCGKLDQRAGELRGVADLLTIHALPCGDGLLGALGVVLDRGLGVSLARDVEWYITDEQCLGRMLDYAVIVPWLQRLYEWSAEELVESRLLELVRDVNPIYAWPFEERHVWRSPHMPFAARVLERVTLVDPPPANRPASRRPQASSCRNALEEQSSSIGNHPPCARRRIEFAASFCRFWARTCRRL
jgi:hypothetical protein